MSHLHQVIDAIRAARVHLVGHRIETQLADAEAVLVRALQAESEKQQIRALIKANSALYEGMANKNRQIVKQGLEIKRLQELYEKRAMCSHGVMYCLPCETCADQINAVWAKQRADRQSKIGE